MCTVNTENIYSSLLLPPRRVREGVPPRGGNEEDGGCGSYGNGIVIDEDEAPAVGVEPWNLGGKGPVGGGMSSRSSSSWVRESSNCSNRNNPSSKLVSFGYLSQTLRSLLRFVSSQ